MKKFLYLTLTVMLSFPRAGANSTATINALSLFNNQLTALANMLEGEEELQETQQETAQRLERQKKFVQQTKAVTPEGQELAKVLEEKTGFPPELAALTVGYLEPYQLKGILEDTLNDKGIVDHLLPLSNGILASSSGRTIKIWDLQDKQLIRKLSTETGITSLVALSPNTFASGSADGSINIWNIQGELLHTFGKAAGRAGVSDMLLAVRHDGKLISAFRSTITVWDLNSTTRIESTTRINTVTSLAIAPNGNLVLGESSPGFPARARVTYLDSITLRELQSIALPKQFGNINIIVFPQGTIAAASNTQKISILPPSAQQGTIPEELSLPPTQDFITLFRFLAVLFDGRLASSRLSYDNQLSNYIHNIIVWNYDEKSNSWTPQLTLAGHKYTISSLAVLPDGRLVSGDIDGIINIWR